LAPQFRQLRLQLLQAQSQLALGALCFAVKQRAGDGKSDQ
jgi:hypothetical protein